MTAKTLESAPLRILLTLIPMTSDAVVTKIQVFE